MSDLFTPAPIEKPSDGAAQPFWSVMIPTFNREAYLAETIRSVLDQDEGAEAMQIAVVDNATTTFAVRELIESLAPGRIEYLRHERNIGGIANINACIRASRGRYVHVLHDDDKVLPGFYAAMRTAIERHPEATLLMSPVLGIDENGFATGLSLTPATAAGPVPDFLRHQAVANRAFNQGTVIPRRVYEEVGGYAEGLAFTPDWEMAFRAAAHGSAVALAMPLAAVRWHGGSDSAQLIRGTRHLEEMKATIDELIARLPAPMRATLAGNRYAFLADAAAHYAAILTDPAEREMRVANLRWAYRLDPSRRRLRALAGATARLAALKAMKAMSVRRS